MEILIRHADGMSYTKQQARCGKTRPLSYYKAVYTVYAPSERSSYVVLHILAVYSWGLII